MAETGELPALGVIPSRASLAYSARFSESWLDALRREGDPLADAVMAELVGDRPVTAVTDLLGEARRRAEGGDALCREFLAACNQVPEWADFDAMATGQRMLAAFPVNMGLALFAGSLVGGSIFIKMTLITSMTGMFGGDSSRRLDETAALVLRMALPGTIEPGGSAHEVLVRVRLLHAAIRRFLVDSGRFSHPVEVPINQQDLAITLGLFGYVNMRSLAQMGVRFNQRELDSFNLLWRWAGHVLGIRDDLLPRSIQDQQAFFIASLKHQARPEKLDARNRVVLDDVARNFSRDTPGVSFAVAQKFLHQACRWLTGNEYVTGMGIEDAGERYWGIRALKLLGGGSYLIWRYVPGGQALLYGLGSRAYRRSLKRMAASKDKKGEYRVRSPR